MSDELRRMRTFAESLRYSGDVRLDNGNGGNGLLTAIRSHLYQNGLSISREVTPTLGERFERACKRLRIPDAVVEAFVYPSPEIQASCISDDTNSCIIRFSSTLIETLSPDEFEFVTGHELGHFLLEHDSGETKQDSLEHFMQSRAAEISADRMGLIACNSLDVSIRAMMKTISGLTSRHLRFDAGTFISQLRNNPSHSDAYSSHPSMLVRCRALLWFSMHDSLNLNTRKSKSALMKLDKRIETDFINYVDGPARKKVEQAKERLSMWLFVRQIAKDGNFSKGEQRKFGEIFGMQALEELKAYLLAIPATRVNEAIERQADEARKVLIAMIPRSSTKEIERIEQSALKRSS